MMKDKKEVGVEPASAEFYPPVLPFQNCEEGYPLAPEMAELRYQLLVRRGQAWGNAKKMAHAL